jgi:hypothetical protein
MKTITKKEGKFRIILRQGHYDIAGEVKLVGGGVRACTAKQVTVRVGSTTRVTLVCDIK